MKIKFPKQDPGGKSPVMTLCGQGKDAGVFVGMVPMTFIPKAGVTRTSDKLVAVNSSTTTNRRGVHSGVIKVTMPYESIIDDGEGGYILDKTRSGSQLSVHLVVALPASAASDLRSSDSVCKNYAKLQVGAAAHLLGVLLQGLIATPLYQDGAGVHTTGMLSTAPTAPGADSAAAAVTNSDDSSLNVQAVDFGYQPTLDGYMLNGGLKASLDPESFPKGAGSIVERIARSMPALSDCQDIEAVHYLCQRVVDET